MYEETAAVITPFLAEMKFNIDTWIPTMVEAVRGAVAFAVILAVGLAIYAALRNYILRAKLTAASLAVVLSAAIYFSVRVAKPHIEDELTLWLSRAFDIALVFALLRVFDRLVVVPLLTRGGRVSLPRFIHQIINIVITIFAILCYGASAFGWDIDKFLAGSAVVSIVLGLALQETLGNFFSGLVMQASSPFSIGDWIICAGVEGKVVDMTWRAVTIHTLEDNWVIVPNGTIAKELITNYNTPTTATARTVVVGLEYDLAPAEATEVLKAAAVETAGVSAQPEPYVFLEQFSDSAITYRVKFWVTDPSAHFKTEQLVRTNIWYRLKHKGFSIPFPTQTVEHTAIEDKQKRQTESSADQRYRAIAGTSLLAPLQEAEKRAIAQGATDVFLSTGQTLFRQDDPGDAFYIIRKGEADIYIRGGATGETKVNTLKAGDFFGEMSALTGQPRSATVRAATALVCVEICKTELKRVFDTYPDVVGTICHIVAERTAHRESVTKAAAAEAETARQQAVIKEEASLKDRVWTFFGGKKAG